MDHALIEMVCWVMLDLLLVVPFVAWLMAETEKKEDHER